MERVDHLKIPFEEIMLATNNFDEENVIALGGFGKVYRGKLSAARQQSSVAVKRLDRKHGQGDREFRKEIQMLSFYRHENLVSLVGFCEDGEERILVYELVTRGSLDKYLTDTDFTWLQRLQVSLGAARGFSYLHNDIGPQHRVLHCDIKSSNILLNDKWEAKISDFGMSKIGPSNVEITFLMTLPCGTMGYIDPQYLETGSLTKESDVYSFGVVLFELLCGMPALIPESHDQHRLLSTLAKQYREQKRIHEMIFTGIKKEIKVDSLNIFCDVAYQCLEILRSERPTMAWIIEKLEKALEIQVSSKVAGYIRLGTWGKQSEDTQNNWSFKLEQAHKLKMITIEHGDVIYSLMFTSEDRGDLHTSNKAGGMAGGETVSEVSFDFDEEIIGINGSICTRGDCTIISSLSFTTNKRTYGPFGQVSKEIFSIPLERGSLEGFYGIASDYIDSFGVYVKSYEEILRVGTWGTTQPGGEHNKWSFQLERNHQLKKITIDHGDLIYSLMFTTVYKGLTHTSEKCGGWNGGETVTEVTFDRDEEIKGISGTVASSRGDYAGYTIVSSITFVTNKKTHGPFGNVRGTSFTLPWDDASFAGFYGRCGYFLDNIGVYLKR